MFLRETTATYVNAALERWDNIVKNLLWKLLACVRVYDAIICSLRGLDKYLGSSSSTKCKKATKRASEFKCENYYEIFIHSSFAPASGIMGMNFSTMPVRYYTACTSTHIIRFIFHIQPWRNWNLNSWAFSRSFCKYLI